MNVSTRKLLVLFYLLFLFMPTISDAQDEKFEAIFLYKFIENINWPDERKNIVVGIVGETQVHDEFEKILQSRNNTSIRVKKIVSAEAGTCDVVFVPEHQNPMLSAILENTYKKSILIVTETAGLTKKGAGIGFLKEKNKLGFVVNKSSLDGRSLKVSNAVLNLSKEI